MKKKIFRYVHVDVNENFPTVWVFREDENGNRLQPVRSYSTLSSAPLTHRARRILRGHRLQAAAFKQWVEYKEGKTK